MEEMKEDKKEEEKEKNQGEGFLMLSKYYFHEDRNMD